MRKILAFVLTVALLLAVSMSVVAAEESDNSRDVMATYRADESTGTVYSVEVFWGSMEFTYTSPAQGTWNPDTHTYDDAQTVGSWTCAADANKVTVVNHSNTQIKAIMTYTSEENFGGITGSFDQKELVLASAEGTAVEAAPTAAAYLTLAGAMEKSTQRLTIGRITVTLDP